MLKCDEKLITDHKDILIGDFQNLLDFDKDKGLLPCALNFSSLPHPPRQPRADRRIWIIAVQLRLLPLHCFRTQTSLPFLIHLANPRQTDRSGLLPYNSDYSPCAAFVPKLLFPSPSTSPTQGRQTHQDYRRTTQIYSPCTAFIPKLLFPSSSNSPQCLSIRATLQMATPQKSHARTKRGAPRLLTPKLAACHHSRSMQKPSLQQHCLSCSN